MSKFETDLTELFSSENRYIRILDNMTEGCQIIDRDWRYIYVNDTAARHGNQTKEGLLNAKMTELYPGIENTEVFRVMRRSMDNIEEHEMENEFTYPDGSKRWFRLTIQPDPEGIFITSIDITERKRAEEEIHRRLSFERLVSEISSEFIRLPLENLDAGIERALSCIGTYSGVDRAYVFLYHEDNELADNTHEWCAKDVDPQIDNLKGVSVKEELPWFEKRIRMRNIFEVSDINKMPVGAEKERKHFANQAIQSLLVIPMVLGDRLIGFLGFDAVFKKRKWTDDEKAILRLVGNVFSNAIKRKSVEQKLRESEQRWQFALEGAGDGLWDWNSETNKVVFSSRWKEMLGYEDDEIGNTLDEWDSRVHPDDKPQVYADLTAHFDGKTDIYQNEHRVLCKEGTYKWILDRGKVIERTEDGKPLRVIGTHSDISDRKRWELEREKYIQELKEALSQIKTLSGLLPICSICKKIRNDEGYWDRIEAYVQKHSSAQFSHSICPGCAKKHYPEFNVYSD